MNGKLNAKTIKNFDNALFFHLLTNDHFQGKFFTKLYVLSTFSNISLPFQEVHLIEGQPWAMNNFLKLTQAY